MRGRCSSYIGRPVGDNDKIWSCSRCSITAHSTSSRNISKSYIAISFVICIVAGIINSVHTSKPEDVENDIEELLDWYNELKDITLEDIIEFHVRFETIHPFNDGNGRVGRIIMFKECLKNNIMPFIILDQHKSFYLRGLKEYKNDKLFLIDTIKNEQDIYETICNDLLECDLEINI